MQLLSRSGPHDSELVTLATDNDVGQPTLKTPPPSDPKRNALP